MPFTLHPQLVTDTLSVGRLSLSEVLLMNDSRFLWCILVPRIHGLRDLHDVPPQFKSPLLADIDHASAAVQEIGRAYKMNVAALGNIVEQLHIHVIARRQDDAAWPGPVWGAGTMVPYEEDAASDLVTQLRARLACALEHNGVDPRLRVWHKQ